MAQTKKQWDSLFVEVPVNGATATYENNVLTLKGAKGEVSKALKFPNVSISVEGDNIKIGTEKLTKREKKIIFTYKAHAANLVKGATEGFTYKLKVVFAKFPMTVGLKGNVFEVKNLLGEKVPRTVTLPNNGVKVDVKGADITVTGVDKEACGQVAANLEQLTRINHLDRRVIQDGIFIVEKPHRVYA